MITHLEHLQLQLIKFPELAIGFFLQNCAVM